MTPADKDLLLAQFELVNLKIDQINANFKEKTSCIEKNMKELDERTTANTRFNWILTGIAAVIGLIAGVLQFNINKS
jgi:ElaB/YqjD/DUF883 family membrane-anchored ribosome-binding protein